MNTSLPISIPQPCTRPWAAMTPTAHGRHCGACQTEVVDFTRLSGAEILAYLARRGGRPVCALANTTQLAAPAPVAPWRRWLLAGLALLGWQPVSSCGTRLPQQLPAQATAAATNSAAAPAPQLIIRGQVLDGASQTAVPQVNVFLNDTKFGTVTDAEGRFELVLARDWAPIAGGTVELRFVGSPFDFQEQTVRLDARAASPGLLVVRLASAPNRGRLMGSIRMAEPPMKPPVK
ncbi:carboxypeptidase-like regulatory domain-containing protein [Hymenobacter sp.]|uniref:carboxypeptidase-like regulatory domain-containing protein n=1 Tax=Hymenobacter sp. TaxID=1898978 RepID=UPI00286BAF24|nr:carboxypeptidase-like regulatory domain-containing protein [Hymenobacter sp.]